MKPRWALETSSGLYQDWSSILLPINALSGSVPQAPACITASPLILVPFHPGHSYQVTNLSIHLVVLWIGYGTTELTEGRHRRHRSYRLHPGRAPSLITTHFTLIRCASRQVDRCGHTQTLRVVGIRTVGEIHHTGVFITLTVIPGTDHVGCVIRIFSLFHRTAARVVDPSSHSGGIGPTQLYTLRKRCRIDGDPRPKRGVRDIPIGHLNGAGDLVPPVGIDAVGHRISGLIHSSAREPYRSVVTALRSCRRVSVVAIETGDGNPEPPARRWK